MSALNIGLILILLMPVMASRAVDRYVSLYGTNDAGGGYTNWVGAATSVIDAVTAASASETIWMSNGVFSLTNNLTIDNSKTLRSVNGRDWTIINGMANGWGAAATTGFYFRMSGAATFIGITVSNGGGRDPSYSAGGIWCNSGNIISSKITHCSTYWGNGAGGITLHGGSVTVTNCIIQNNYAPNSGGGVILINNGTLEEVKNCIIQNNYAANIGGGATIWGASSGAAIMENCIIRNNTNAAGGGLGGGICYYRVGIVRNCLVVSNYATVSGGGIYIQDAKYYRADAEIDNCTIVGNVCPDGGGIKIDNTRNTNTVINCIVYSNFADLAHSNPDDVRLQNPVCTNAFLYSRLTNSIPSDRHCITGDPLLMDCAGGNFRLQANSPCINAGTNESWMTNGVDLDERTRTRYGTVDMGAYEHIQSGTIFSFH